MMYSNLKRDGPLEALNDEVPGLCAFYRGHHMRPGQLWQMSRTGNKRGEKRGEEEKRGDERKKAGREVCACCRLLTHLSNIDCMPAVSQLNASPEISISIPFYRQKTEAQRGQVNIWEIKIQTRRSSPRACDWPTTQVAPHLNKKYVLNQRIIWTCWLLSRVAF